MQLEGIHHITAITADAQQNVDFYAGTLGLRMVKKTVNQDEPSVYHLFYADEDGSPGADLTFFEFPHAALGRAGAGMVYRIGWRVASEASLDFWADRLASQGFESERVGDVLRFRDPEGLEHELGVDDSGDDPLIAEHPEVPAEHALRGFSSARAYSADPSRSQRLLDGLGFEGSDGSYELRGSERGGTWHYDAPPAERGIQGAGTVHHIAWASRMDDQEAWRDRAAEYGARPTDVIDRFWFRSIYFREPSGVLFEIATIGPGFDADEPKESLGESLVLPPFLEDRREQIERVLTPITNPRQAREAS
ncbi:ring-cleaving dioxygenase [Thermoleophilia bacterium SCSIO 60948]|nr:ring-cleaving dioxygenase [Thermoleophilia bacterium SCSIO 60948]